MNLRQQQQQAFDRSGEPLIVGNVSHCPLPPETLAALGPDSPYVVQVYGSGLTGEVYRLRIAGKEYNLKKRRAVAGVANLNGQLSFLNEVQRRQALQQLKDDPVTAPRFTHIVPTLYADYRLGILLSPWIDGEPIHQLTPPLIAQLFTTLEACEEQGLMEWDLCSGESAGGPAGAAVAVRFWLYVSLRPAERIQQQWSGRPAVPLCRTF